jgi:hypothetical protein
MTMLRHYCPRGVLSAGLAGLLAAVLMMAAQPAGAVKNFGAAARTSAAAARSATHVYLLRGIFNVSVGLDDLAAKLVKLGIPASVYGHGDADEVAAEAVRDYESGKVRSVILIGHSLGAGAVLALARDLDMAGVPVSLLISLDPVFHDSVTANVRRAINYYVPGTGVAIDRDAGFRGDLKNIDVGDEPGMGHMAVQSAETMHKRMIDSVQAVVGNGAPPATKIAPAPLKHAGANVSP